MPRRADFAFSPQDFVPAQGSTVFGGPESASSPEDPVPGQGSTALGELSFTEISKALSKDKAFFQQQPVRCNRGRATATDHGYHAAENQFDRFQVVFEIN